MSLLAAAIATEPQTAWQWTLAVFNIVWIDLVLAGDNAVVIALAVRNLPEKQKRVGIIVGSLAAVILRASLTAITTQLLVMPYVKLVGGVLILWIALKLLRQGESHGEGNGDSAKGVWQAVWMIIVADITMSLDNVLAVGGAAGGNTSLIVFGLLLSIPLVVWGSKVISTLMARFPIIVLVGAAILGKVAGDMILTDVLVAKHAAPWWARTTQATDTVIAYNYLRYFVEFVLAAGIFAYGWFRKRKTA
ncbi:MAG: TerC family protein [Opitutaceae bacterium]|nr:TerC family protein [Opitutaceae bacterium]